MFPQRMLIHAICSHLYSCPSSTPKTLFPSSIKASLGQTFTPGAMEHSTNGSRLPWLKDPIEIKSTETIYPVVTKPRLLIFIFFVSPFLFFWNSKQMICSSMPPFCWVQCVKILLINFIFKFMTL